MPSVPPTLTSPALAQSGFAHGFTTRGAGLYPLASCGLAEAEVYLVSQVHGSSVVLAEGDVAAFRTRQADAIILTGSLAGAVRVADCVPVLVGDSASGRAAAIHAGWRGVASGVVPAALAALRAKPGNLVAAIGPCIEACCFEVGEDVADQVTFAVPAPGVEVRRAAGKAWVDLVTAVRAQLEACGVPATSIDRVGGCTKCDAEMYESFRRDGSVSGRMFGAIAAHA
jgi:YfiH family protein